jgi:hypothetical protein
MAALVLMSWAFIAEAMCSFAAAVRLFFDSERKMREMQARHDEEMWALRVEMVAMQRDMRVTCKRDIAKIGFLMFLLFLIPVLYVYELLALQCRI